VPDQMKRVQATVDVAAHKPESCRAVRLTGETGSSRILDYLDKGDENRCAGSFYLSLMRFGDTDKRLVNL